MMLTLLLISMLTFAFNIQSVKAEGTIYIRPDGTVDPPTTPIQRDGDVYTLTDNIYESIVVQRNNIVVDGAGCTVQGTGRGTGVHLEGRNNVTIKNMEIMAFDHGIYLFHSSNSSISGNNITSNNFCGLTLVDSSNIVLKNNIMAGNRYSFGVFGSTLSHFIHDIETSNTIDGKLIYYLINQNSVVINSSTYPDLGYLALINSNNVTVEGLELKNNDQGILLAYTTNSQITNNTISNNSYGVWLSTSSNNTVTANNITSNNFCGLTLVDSSSFNTVSANNITNNSYSGFYLNSSSNNLIFHNNFVNNTKQVYDPSWVFPQYAPSINVWDDGYPTGGNYWSDYEERYPDAKELDDSGIWDTPYVIDENNQDNYPLMKPWGVPLGMSADLVRREAWPEHHRFVLSRDGDPSVDDRHGTPGNQTLYGIVKNTGNVAIPAGTYKVVWNISSSTGSSRIVETVGSIDLAPGEITVLTYDVPAIDLAPGKYYVEARCYYYAVEGEKVKMFSFTVAP